MATLLIAVVAISVPLHLRLSPKQTVTRLARAAGLAPFPRHSQVKIEAYAGSRGLIDGLMNGLPRQVAATVCVRLTGWNEDELSFSRSIQAQAQTKGPMSMSEHRYQWSMADGTKWTADLNALDPQFRLYLNTSPPGDYDGVANRVAGD